MPLPDPLETVTVRGDWISPLGGGALAGWAQLTAVTTVRSPAGDVALSAERSRHDLVAGAAEWTEVVLSDSPGLAETITYRLRVRGVDGVFREDRLVQFFTSAVVGGVIRLDDVPSATVAPEIVTYLLASLLGEPGGAAGPLDVDGTLPADQLPAGGGGAVASVDGRTGVVTLGDLYTDPAELAAGLAAKANTVHTHSAAQVTDLTTFIDTRVQLVVDAAPAALDTLNELAAAIGDDANFAGTITVALAGKQPLDADLSAIAALAPADGSVLARVAGAWSSRTGAQLKADLGITAADVGLGDVANLAPASLPISTATQAALDLTAPLASPAFTGTPTGITKAHVGLGNVANVAPADLGISTATQIALDGKAASNHKHPLELILDGYGFVGASGDPGGFNGSATPGGSDHLIGFVVAQPGVSIAAVRIANQNAGTYLATGVPAQAKVYDFDGALLGASPDDPTLWLAAGWRTATLTASIIVPPSGLLFVGVSFGGFSNAQPLIQNNNHNAAVIAGLIGGRRRSIYASGASLPNSFNPATYGTETTWYVAMGVVAA